MDRDKLKGTILVIISAITFGSIPLFSKFAYAEGMSVCTLLFLRFFTASVILWPYMFIKKLNFKLNKNVFMHLLLISLLGYTLSASGLFYSYKYISTSLAAIILYCYPIIVVGYEMFKYKKIDFKKLFCLFTTSFGLVLVVFKGTINLNWTGITLAIISCISYSYFCIGLNDKKIQKLDSIIISTYVMTFCAIFYFFQLLFTHSTLNTFMPPNLKSFIYALIIGFFCSVIPTITLYNGIKIIGVSTSVIISTFEPIFVCILGSIFFNEVITTNMIIGGIVIILSLIFLQIPMKKILVTHKNIKMH